MNEYTFKGITRAEEAEILDPRNYCLFIYFFWGLLVWWNIQRNNMSLKSSVRVFQILTYISICTLMWYCWWKNPAPLWMPEMLVLPLKKIFSGIPSGAGFFLPSTICWMLYVASGHPKTATICKTTSQYVSELYTLWCHTLGLLVNYPISLADHRFEKNLRC